MTLPRTPDVLVVGGGVIGCAVGHALARPGRSVLVIDRGALGGEASTAAAGVLAVGGGDDDGRRLALRRTGLARFPALVETLREEGGVDVRFERAGIAVPCFDDDETAAARARLAHRAAQGLRAEWLDAPALRRVTRLVDARAVGGACYPDDARVSPSLLIEALAAAARRRGATLAPGVELRAVERDGSRVARALVGGDWLTPGLVVVAAGAWSARVPGIPSPCAVVPARGQMLALRAPAAVGGPTLSHAGGYLVPQPTGEVLVGATVEHAGFTRAVTPAGVAWLLGHLLRAAPHAAGWPVVRLWAGLRPEAPDGGPWIGRHPEVDGVIFATGHHRNGILLAPVTAAAVAAVVDGTSMPPEVAGFGGP